MKGTLALFILSVLWFPSNAQQPTQTVKGRVIDQSSGQPIEFANIILIGLEPTLGAVSNTKGRFQIENVPVGRYNLKASNIGFETIIISEVEVISSKETFVDFHLTESVNMLNNVEIKAKLDKEKTLNEMAIISARMLSVEESQRYAGGFDDPARLASAFAGVTSGVNNNAIVVRGNAPKSLQWKMEGIEIPNPNHFADLASFGGGAVTGLSGQLLGNSDFLTGAFPAEYNNALSGVFDINMRTGNNSKRETTAQIGVMGIDLASEGPFKKEGNSSYLFNYRYSTFGLVSKLTNANEGIEYQDLSFKLHFPTKKAGVFSIWGIGLVDGIMVKEKTDSSEWVYQSDRENYNAQQYMGAYGIGHSIFLNEKSLIKTTLATTVSGTDWKMKSLNANNQLTPKSNAQNTVWNLVLNSSIKTKFSKTHTNKTGINSTSMLYDIFLENKDDATLPTQVIVDEKGNSYLFSAFSHSIFRKNKFTYSVGLNGQYFSLNNTMTFEPRLGMRYQWKANQSLGFAYGLHSRLERLNFYFTKNLSTGIAANQSLGFSKAHHFVGSYALSISDNLKIKMEPYFQYLFNIPVVENSPISLINLQNDWFVTDVFNSSGKGRNYGIDLTLEKYLNQGYYYLLSASLFNSEYLGGDGVWRNTRFNRNYTINALGGKEWQLGKNKQNTLGVNARINYMGGERYVPYKLTESLAAQEVIEDYENAFSESIDPAFIFHFTVSYKMNRAKSSHEIALKVLNATSYGDFQGFAYNATDNTIDKSRETIMIPNIGYKINFYRGQ